MPGGPLEPLCPGTILMALGLVCPCVPGTPSDHPEVVPSFPYKFGFRSRLCRTVGWRVSCKPGG